MHPFCKQYIIVKAESILFKFTLLVESTLAVPYSRSSYTPKIIILGLSAKNNFPFSCQQRQMIRTELPFWPVDDNLKIKFQIRRNKPPMIWHMQSCSSR